jgi:subtilisin-like proprotein convertase family protein
VLNFDSYIQENCDLNTLRYTFTITRKENFIDPFSLRINSLPVSLESKSSKQIFTSSDTEGHIDLVGLSNLNPGDYELSLEAFYGTDSEIFDFELKQRDNFISPAFLQSPINESNDISLNPALEWESNINADNFRIQIAKDLSFSNIIFDELTPSSQIQVNDLASATDYYWRVQQINNCEVADFSEIYSFKTNTISCTDLSATDLPKKLIDATANGQGTIFSSINVNFDSTILDVDVRVDLTHSWINDLSLYLETPGGDKLLLSSSIGGADDNYTQTLFDQEASLNIVDGTAPFTGRFAPVQNISSIYGSSSKGIWKLIILDQEAGDSGDLLGFELSFCLEGSLEINSDNDSLNDDNDNCPEITNEDQADIDNNNIGDVCDIFSAQNLSLVKKDATCPNSDNGALIFNARADYLYKGEINGPNGFQDEFTFTKNGFTLNNLTPGNYDLCISSDRFLDFEYCFQTQITAPEELRVQSVYNPSIGILNLEMFGSDVYKISLNDQSFDPGQENSIQLPLTKKINRVTVETDKICQGIFERWINLDNQAKVFPNPIPENANIILPQDMTVDLNLFSGSGEVCWTKKGVVEKQESIQIPMSHLPKGWYILQIDYGSYTEIRKLLKE